MKHRNTLLLFLLLVLTGTAGWAGELEIFIRNKTFSGPYFSSGGQIYIPLQDLARCARLTLHSKGSAYCLFNPETGDKECPISASEPSGLVLYAGGKKTAHFPIEKGGILYAPMKDVADNLGWHYIYTPETKTVDFATRKKQVIAAPVVTQIPTFPQAYTLVNFGNPG